MLILTASVGSGHSRAAEAVAAALRASFHAEGVDRSVRVVDVLAESSRLVRAICRDAYVGLVQRAPTVVGWLYRRYDRPARAGLRSRLLWTGLRAVRRIVETSGAEAIVSTHFLASEIAARLAREGRAPSLSTVVTDIDAHGLWIWPGTSNYFVAGARGVATLRRAGVDPSIVHATGIPIDPVFERVPPRRWAREALGLDADRPVILFSTGGCCIGPVESMLRALARGRTPAQIAVICGRSASARERLEAAAADLQPSPGVSIRVEGFSDRMQVWMAASDLFVGKPGGLTSAECQATGLPMVIVHAIPGQEEHNADELVQRGAAVRASLPSQVAPLVDALLADASRRGAMRAAAMAGAMPDAARRIAECITTTPAARSDVPFVDAPRAPAASRRSHSPTR